ncbi:hypothetical protein D3C85_1092260 [compost metagenome]
MHRPALAFAGTGCTAHELGDEGPQWNALGQLVVDTAVGGDDVVIGPQVDRDRRRNDFLTARGVVRRGDLPGLDQLDEAVVGRLDQIGPAVDIQQHRAVRGFGLSHGDLTCS